MDAHWIHATIGEECELVLEHLPFSPGERVDVLVLHRSPASTSDGRESLRGSVIAYTAPFEPVAREDWEVLG